VEPLKFYKEAMLEHDKRHTKGAYTSFSPHITQQTYEAGLRYLKNQESKKESQDASDGLSAGQMLLALAMVRLPEELQDRGDYFNWLSVEIPKIRLLRKFPQEIDEVPLPRAARALTANSIFSMELPKEFINWIEGGDLDRTEAQKGKDIGNAFRTVLWENLCDLIDGEDRNGGIGTKRFIKILTEMDEECIQKAEKAYNQNYKMTWEFLGRALNKWCSLIQKRNSDGSIQRPDFMRVK